MRSKLRRGKDLHRRAIGRREQVERLTATQQKQIEQTRLLGEMLEDKSRRIDSVLRESSTIFEQRLKSLRDLHGKTEAAWRDQFTAHGGYEIDYWSLADNRPNVVATRKGSGGGQSLIWSAHTDVVPVTPEQAEQWEGAGPFSGGDGNIVNVLAGLKITFHHGVYCAVRPFGFVGSVGYGVAEDDYVRPHSAVDFYLREKPPNGLSELFQPRRGLTDLGFTGIADQKEVPAAHPCPHVGRAYGGGDAKQVQANSRDP